MCRHTTLHLCRQFSIISYLVIIEQVNNKNESQFENKTEGHLLFIEFLEKILLFQKITKMGHGGLRSVFEAGIKLRMREVNSQSGLRSIWTRRGANTNALSTFRKYVFGIKILVKINHFVFFNNKNVLR